MEIEFVNHASVVLHQDDIHLICDPWLEGRVFHNGWQHHSRTVFSYQDFARITHIWFSHEHPDHFFPPNVKSIPEEFRRRITVLYQRTRDQKVVEFCRGLNFREVIELPPHEEVALSPNCTIVNGAIEHDSWLYVVTPDARLLNTNDCVTRTPASAEALRSKVGPVDVLLTQFSYAGYAGNADQPEKRREAVRAKYEQMKLQIRTLQPKMCVPTASFVWFCHEENFYMNDEINPIEKVVDFLRDEDVTPVVLYPGDRWQPGAPHDPASAVARYRKDISTLITRENTIRSKTVPLENLQEAAAKFIARLRGKDWFAHCLLGFFPLHIFLTDLRQSVTLSVRSGLRPTHTPESGAHLKISSEVLDYCLKMDWGFETTMINARFQVNRPSDYQRINYYVSVADTMNHQDSSFQRVLGKVNRTVRRRIGLAPSAS